MIHFPEGRFCYAPPFFEKEESTQGIFTKETLLQFNDLQISKPILRALLEEGYTEPSPIQTKAIPPLLEGHDILGTAQTGTGKTAAFAVPILQMMSFSQRSTASRKEIKALILAPTRELAIQIGESFDTYGKYLSLRTAVIFGGVSQHPQTKALAAGIDILVATPGRLLDLMGQKFISLSHVTYFVLDEADRMLDMGMLRDVKRIIAALPAERQTMFFSATMPPEIEGLADSILNKPERIEITPVSSTVDTIRQSVYFVNKSNKIRLLVHLLRTTNIESALVFSRTKHGADKIVKALAAEEIDALAIHGNKSQNARQAALSNFKSRKTKILVATDIAARGIDIDELSHVILFDLPEVPETYVHRIGRTGRAGLGGTAISFCDKEEKLLLRDIQKLIGKTVPVVDGHPYPLDESIDESSKKTAGRGFRESTPAASGRASSPKTRKPEARQAVQETRKPEVRQTAPLNRKPEARQTAPSNRQAAVGNRAPSSRPASERNRSPVSGDRNRPAASANRTPSSGDRSYPKKTAPMDNRSPRNDRDGMGRAADKYILKSYRTF